MFLRFHLVEIEVPVFKISKLTKNLFLMTEIEYMSHCQYIFKLFLDFTFSFPSTPSRLFPPSCTLCRGRVDSSPWRSLKVQINKLNVLFLLPLRSFSLEQHKNFLHVKPYIVNTECRNSVKTLKFHVFFPVVIWPQLFLKFNRTI